MSEEQDRVVTESILKSGLTILKSELELALTDLEKRVEKRITEEGALTRAQFNIMVEKVNDSVRLVAEVNGHQSSLIRGASPLGLPDTRSRAPLRRRAPFAWLTRCRSFADARPPGGVL